MIDRFWSVLALQGGYNTTVVLIGTTLLGIGAAVIGTFVLLRKRALVSDAVSHATLPGIGFGFLVAYGLGLDGGRNLPILLLAAAATGAVGVVAVQWIRDHTRLPEDTAIGSVLSVAFGVGMVLLSYIQTLPGGSRAGLDSFLIGQTAALSRSEAWVIAIGAAIVFVACLLLFKEFAVLCFDPDFARAQGWPVRRLDLLMMALMLVTVCIGLKTVGLVLIIALLIIPPVAARFWTDGLARMLPVAALFGGLSGYLGAAQSAVVPELPAGGVIVLTAGGLFALSLLFAPRRGIVAGTVRAVAFRFAAIERRALVGLTAGRRPSGPGAVVLRLRGYIDRTGRATADGIAAAHAANRDQALWLRYLADHPQQALMHDEWAWTPIDRVLPPDLVAELERRVAGAG